MFSLNCVLGSLGGTLKRPEEMVYAYINNTDVTITNSEIVLIAAFCDNSIVQESLFLGFMAYCLSYTLSPNYAK